MNKVTKERKPLKAKKKSIATRMLLYLATFGLFALSLNSFTLFTQLKTDLRQRVREEVSLNSYRVFFEFEQSLQRILGYVQTFSENHFVVNALIDPSGRETYLPKIASELTKDAGIKSVVISDYKGKQIFSRKPSDQGFSIPKNLRDSVLHLGKTEIIINTQQKTEAFIIIPISYYATVQGMIIASLDLVEIAQSLPSLTFSNTTKGLRLMTSDADLVNFTNAADLAGEFIEFESDKNLVLDSNLKIRIRYYGIDAEIQGLIFRILGNLVFINLIIFLVAIGFAFVLVKVFTKPIVTLTRKIKTADITQLKCSPLGTNDELEELAEAFDSIAANLVNMNRNLDQLVFDRTFQLTLINQILQDLEKEEEEEEELTSVLEMICKNMDWDIGHIYKKEGLTLRPTGIFFSNIESDKVSHFIEITKKTAFKLGEGLPGRVAESRKAAWIKDVMQDDNFPRAKLDTALEVHAGAAFPVLDKNDNVLFVLEFFSLKNLDKDEESIDFLNQVCEVLSYKNEFRKNLKLLNDQNLALNESSIVAITDNKGKITFVNSKFCEISQYCEEELIGKDHRIINSGHHSKEFFKDFWGTIKDGKIWKGEIKNKAKDGSHYWVDTTIVPIKDQTTGQIEQYLAIRHDITNVKDAQEKLEKQKSELLNANKDLEHFAYVASHDLQEPVRTVGSFSNLLEKKFGDKLDDEGKKYVHFCVEAAQRMRLLIKDLLEYSRVGTSEDKYEKVDMKSLLETNLQELDLFLKESKTTINLANDLPSIQGDPIKLSQIIQNLIKNGVKFHKKDVSPEITIEYTQNDSHHIFSFKDNGIGIKDEFQDKIFVIFQRLHSREEYEGTGIGLAVCKRIVQKHGGDIWVETKYGEGSTFFFSVKKNLTRQQMLGEILVQDGLLTKEQLEDELKKQRGIFDNKGDDKT